MGLKRKDCKAKSDQDFLRQRLFVQEYLKDFNGRQAAIRAGYSKSNAARHACRLLGFPHIARMVEEAQAAAFARCQLSVDRVIQEMMRIAFIDPAELFDDNGELKPISQIPREYRAAISSISRNSDGTRITLWSKVEALRDLGKHLRMFVEQIEHKDTTPIAEQLAKARERVKAGLEFLAATSQPEDPTVPDDEASTDQPEDQPDQHPHPEAGSPE
jgi:phage terminase small subunit